MNSEYLLIFLGILSNGASYFVSYLVTKKKYHKEVEQSEIDNLSKIIDIQQDTINFLQSRLDITEQRNNILENKVLELEKFIRNMSK